MTTYTRQGATKSVSSNWFNGQKVYTKSKLSGHAIQNFKYMMNLGIGVKLLSVDQNTGTIQMQGGHTIRAIVQKHIVGAQGRNLIWKHISRIWQILLNNQIAHTDIKPANIAVKFLSQDLKNFKVFLIDNDDVKKFGQIRQVGTPDFNCNLESLMAGQKVNSNTDKMGFENLKKYMGV